MTTPRTGPVDGSWIEDLTGLPPFFMTVVSGGDRWMYLASTGALTAGRRNPDGALFAYETDDRLCNSDGLVGPRTCIWVDSDAAPVRWEPFLRSAEGQHRIRRRLFKSYLGDEVRFEEIHEDLGLRFRYGWRSGDRYGFVRNVELTNLGSRSRNVRLLDGLLGILPACVDRGMQAGFSNLVDAYKQSSFLPAHSLAVFRLNSIPIDRAVPNEAMLANVAWLHGLEEPNVLLSTRQLQAFRQGQEVTAEPATRGVAGALLACTHLQLEAGATRTWQFGLDAGLDAKAVVELADRNASSNLQADIASDLDADRRFLTDLIAAADGLQSTADRNEDARHLANTLFNVMRGGTLLDDGTVGCADFRRFLTEAAPRIAARDQLSDWPERMRRDELVSRAEDSGDIDLERLAREYLPLTFSRRHGDPSRPWNLFSIETRNADGSSKLRYEGNWRDIFQNWEALLHSFPAYAEAAVTKFVNATTADGFNPYRVMREGFDWEVPDPADPWAHIGYWGDHQIVYLQRLLTLCENHSPGRLAALLRRRIFVFADVPYRLAGYRQLLEDPHETISFATDRDREMRTLHARLGNEAYLLPDGLRAEATPRRASLGEKLLIPILSKLSHFIPGLGIWMNTQRPEWNDANNALVGHGVSIVTACQLARHCDVVKRLVEGSGSEPLPISAAALRHLEETAAVLDNAPGTVKARWAIDRLGEAGARYREAIYANDPSARASEDVKVAEVVRLLENAIRWLQATVRDNLREDGLVHSYNLLTFDSTGDIVPRRLPQMLEGQVAAIASGALSPIEIVELLDALRASPLRREDLGTYMLYPDREPQSFLDKGLIPPELLQANAELPALVARGEERLLRRDSRGQVRFAPNLHNAEDLADTAKELGLGEQAQRQLQAVYEAVFDHAAFTGRSGSFFGYEGLGSVYWHMVSKLRLAVLETWQQVRVAGADTSVLDRLSAHYGDIRKGLGVSLPPERYGAFPSDPYSHTPAHAGARQPGMTGQVKEDLLCRRLELGLVVEAGCIVIQDAPIWPGTPCIAAHTTQLGQVESARIETGQIGLSLYGLPVTWRAGDGPRIVVHLKSGETVSAADGRLDPETSREILLRSGKVTRIELSSRIG